MHCIYSDIDFKVDEAIITEAEKRLERLKLARVIHTKWECQKQSVESVICEVYTSIWDYLETGT